MGLFDGIRSAFGRGRGGGSGGRSGRSGGRGGFLGGIFGRGGSGGRGGSAPTGGSGGGLGGFIKGITGLFGRGKGTPVTPPPPPPVTPPPPPPVTPPPVPTVPSVLDVPIVPLPIEGSDEWYLSNYGKIADTLAAKGYVEEFKDDKEKAEFLRMLASGAWKNARGDWYGPKVFADMQDAIRRGATAGSLQEEYNKWAAEKKSEQSLSKAGSDGRSILDVFEDWFLKDDYGDDEEEKAADQDLVKAVKETVSEGFEPADINYIPEQWAADQRTEKRTPPAPNTNKKLTRKQKKKQKGKKRGK